MVERLQALSDYRKQLQNYDEGARLKIAAMNEVKDVLQELELSQRQFVGEARRLGYSVSSAQSLSYWIKCTHIPSPLNVDHLTDALLGVLRENGHNGEPWKEMLRESSFLHNHTLENFRRDAQNLEQAKELFDATVAWLNMTEFPPSIGGWSGRFVPITREQGVQCLDILRQIHFAAAEKITTPQAAEHELLAAKAAVILANLFNSTGRYFDALEAADEGGYVLEGLLDKYPAWREQTIEGYRHSLGETFTLLDLSILAQTRKAAALHALSHVGRTAKERADYRNMAQRALLHAHKQASRLPSNSPIAPDTWRAGASITLDNAESLHDLQQAFSYARCAQQYTKLPVAQSRIMRVQEFLALISQTEASARMGRLNGAVELLGQAEEIERELAVNLRLPLGPAHLIAHRRALASYWMGHAESHKIGTPRWREFAHRWRDSTVAGLKLANEAGLYNQERRLRILTSKSAPEYRRILARVSAL